MVSVRKRGKVYEYRFEIATVDGTRKWITKSGYRKEAEKWNQFMLKVKKEYLLPKENK